MASQHYRNTGVCLWTDLLLANNSQVGPTARNQTCNPPIHDDGAGTKMRTHSIDEFDHPYLVTEFGVADDEDVGPSQIGQRFAPLVEIPD